MVKQNMVLFSGDHWFCVQIVYSQQIALDTRYILQIFLLLTLQWKIIQPTIDHVDTANAQVQMEISNWYVYIKDLFLKDYFE